MTFHHIPSKNQLERGAVQITICCNTYDIKMQSFDNDFSISSFEKQLDHYYTLKSVKYYGIL